MDDKRTPERTTQPAPRDEHGHALASDGRPAHAHARAKALAEDKLGTDPLGLVSDELIAVYAKPEPKAKPSKTAETKEN